VFRPTNPLLVLLLASALILLIGFAVLLAARRWPRAVSTLLVLLIVAGLGALGYAASPLCAAADAGRWLAGGLALVILSCPAWVLVPSGGAPHDSFADPGVAQRGTMLVVGYLFACWFFALAVAIFVFLTTSPPGSLR
jgi:hypothetical protein